MVNTVGDVRWILELERAKNEWIDFHHVPALLNRFWRHGKIGRESYISTVFHTRFARPPAFVSGLLHGIMACFELDEVVKSTTKGFVISGSWAIESQFAVPGFKNRRQHPTSIRTQILKLT